ncbi:MAG: hypothetical protein FWC03_12280 [Treponema sp.]|nr:hypothetical protein [Treponema sp.]
MPWRLIIFIAIFGVFLVFITFNLENKCDISFGIFSINEVPVFVTVFASFAMGLLCALPLVMHIKKKNTRKPLFIRKKKESDEMQEHPDSEASDQTGKDAAPAREGFFSKRNKGGNE